MKNIDRIDIWWGRLPLGRWFETIIVAGILFFLAALFWPRSAFAQDAAQMERIATAAALEKSAEANIELAKTLRAAIERIAGGPASAPAAAPPVNPAAKTCDGFGSCLLGVFKAVTEGVGDVTRAVAPIAMPYYGYKGQVVAAEATKVANQEATKQVAFREQTNQAGYATAAQIAASGTAGLVAVATQPPPPVLPTTQVTVTGNGPVNTGNGTITNASNNPANPAPVVCTVATATVPSTCSRGP